MSHAGIAEIAVGSGRDGIIRLGEVYRRGDGGGIDNDNREKPRKYILAV